MSLDAAVNFAKVTVSTGYTSGSTSIVLNSGQGARMPTAPFNATWWNASDYGDPADDPNVEIVRVTAISTDTLTVTRAQEGTIATAKNIATKTYKMLAGLTAATMTAISTFQNGPIAIGVGGTGATSFLAAGLPTLSASTNTFTGAMSVAGGITVTGTLGATLGVYSNGTANGSNNYGSNPLYLTGSYWNGLSAISDQWTIQNVIGTGTTPLSTLQFSHSGAPSDSVSMPALTLATPLPITSGGIGAVSFAGAGLPTLTANNTFFGTTTLYALVFNDQSGARTSLGLGAAALLATPIPIASGGTGATSFLSAGLPTLSASNAFTGVSQTFTPTISTGAASTHLSASPTISGTSVSTINNIYSKITLAASATLTSASGVRVDTPSLGSGATVSFCYGLYIAAQAATLVSYGIYQAGTSDFNIFNGPVNASSLSLTTPLGIGFGGTGATSFLSAGLPTLSTANTFSGNQSVTTGGFTTLVGGNTLAFNCVAGSFIDQYALSGTLVFRTSISTLSDTTVLTLSTTSITAALPAVFSSTVAVAGTTARQQLSVGTSLDIYSSASSNSPTTNSIRAITNGIVINANSTGLVYFNYDSGTGGVGFYNGSAGLVASISSAGVIGGTSLALSSAQTITAAAPQLTLTSTAAAQFAHVELINDVTSTYYFRQWGSTIAGTIGGITIANWATMWSNGGNGLIVETANSTPLVFGTADTERMRLSPAGRLLIGTTTDNGTDKLQVNGTILTTGITLTGKVTTYNNVATVANGVGAIVAQINATAQSANISVATLYAVPSTGAGMYRIHSYVVVTRAATTSSTMPACGITYTDESGTAHGDNWIGTTSSANTVGTNSQATSPPSYTFYAKASTNIQYETDSYASSGATTMQYSLRIRLEFLG